MAGEIDLFLGEGKVLGGSWNWAQNGYETAFLETCGAGYLVPVVSDHLLQPWVALCLLSVRRAAPGRGGKWQGRIATGKWWLWSLGFCFHLRYSKYSRSSARRGRTRQLNPLPRMGGHAALKRKVHIWSALNSPKRPFVWTHILHSNLIYLGIGHHLCLLMSAYVAIISYSFKSFCSQSLHSPLC